ncbi:YwhD family protein [Chengkuizengella marina]|uniref:YwhD family protein n=1 Tax=Chengkuizengella marina TaxID=2507566 RepID=A0A6N9Q8B2_9BACL|nr:YwhD family protein [Chengkuizengella marina]NBI31059.1 hypothetical protein [Chengkuizengella marina]
MNFDKKGKKNLSLNVVSNKEHKGFGAGMINLSQMSSMIIDGDKAYIDIGALHAKSKVEKGIKFLTDKEEVPNGRKCWVAWVAVDRNEEGSYYAGVTVCEMLIDEEARRGWKILADHVNKMDKALKRKFILDGLDDTEKTALRTALIEHNQEWWENSGDELKEGLSA